MKNTSKIPNNLDLKDGNHNAIASIRALYWDSGEVLEHVLENIYPSYSQR